MKKNELAKKSRKLFSAILAGAMLTTSVIPESFVWAAEAEEVQEGVCFVEKGRYAKAAEFFRWIGCGIVRTDDSRRRYRLRMRFRETFFYKAYPLLICG